MVKLESAGVADSFSPDDIRSRLLGFFPLSFWSAFFSRDSGYFVVDVSIGSTGVWKSRSCLGSGSSISVSAAAPLTTSAPVSEVMTSISDSAPRANDEPSL